MVRPWLTIVWKMKHHCCNQSDYKANFKRNANSALPVKSHKRAQGEHMIYTYSTCVCFGYILSSLHCLCAMDHIVGMYMYTRFGTIKVNKSFKRNAVCLEVPICNEAVSEHPCYMQSYNFSYSNQSLINVIAMFPSVVRVLLLVWSLISRHPTRLLCVYYTHQREYKSDSHMEVGAFYGLKN